jgi:hypothetical protein
MAPSALTLNFDSLLSTTLFKWSKELADEITTANAVYYMIRKSGAYQTMADIGQRAAFPLMYQLGSADWYSGYDVMDVTPMEGITAAFYDWRQLSVPITISGDEELKNAGEEQIIALLDAKATQAEMGIKTAFNQAMLQGNGGTAITSAKVGILNPASVGIDPLPFQVAYDPTAAGSPGNINQNLSANSWWRNQTKNSTSTTYAGFLKEMRSLRNNCGKGPGGYPDLNIVDQATYELYEAALAAAHRNPSYESADIPFDNIAFHKKPVTWDEYVPDVQGGSATQSSTSGTWWMLNTKFWGIKVHASRDFSTTPFMKPIDQDAKTAHILWYGAMGCSNRRKQGVSGGIDSTISS